MDKAYWVEHYGNREEFRLFEVHETVYDDYYVATWKENNEYVAVDNYTDVNEEYGRFATKDEMTETVDRCLQGNVKSYKNVELPKILNGVDDFSYYGLSEPYPEVEKELKIALSEGNDFDTDWHGSKHEIESIQIVAFGNKIIINHHCEMDDFPEIIDDAIDGDAELSDEIFDEIEEALCSETGFSTEVTESTELPRTASYEEVMEAIDQLETDGMKALDERFEMVKEQVACYISI